MADRRENSQLRDIPSEISSASPYVIEEKMQLVLWLDSVYPLNPFLVTHELGHWILMLRGFKVLVDPARTYGDIIVNLNSADVKFDILRLTVEVIACQSVNIE